MCVVGDKVKVEWWMGFFSQWLNERGLGFLIR